MVFPVSRDSSDVNNVNELRSTDTPNYKGEYNEGRVLRSQEWLGVGCTRL